MRSRPRWVSRNHPAEEETAQAARAEGAAERAFAVGEGLDGNSLEDVGWGVIFAPNVDAKIKDALQPLIDHRKEQGANPFVIYDQDGYRPGETAFDWLKRRGTRLDVVDPNQGVPFYLLIVAPPDVIPFEFQYMLDLYWAVGRLWFDTPDEFRRYAESVVQYEKAATVPTTRQLALFAPGARVRRGDAAVQSTGRRADARWIGPQTRARRSAAEVQAAVLPRRQRDEERASRASFAATSRAAHRRCCSAAATGWRSTWATPASSRSRERWSARTGIGAVRSPRTTGLRRRMSRPTRRCTGSFTSCSPATAAACRSSTTTTD